jgi:hypothetical protein
MNDEEKVTFSHAIENIKKYNIIINATKLLSEK